MVRTFLRWLLPPPQTGAVQIWFRARASRLLTAAVALAIFSFGLNWIVILLTGGPPFYVWADPLFMVGLFVALALLRRGQTAPAGGLFIWLLFLFTSLAVLLVEQSVLSAITTAFVAMIVVASLVLDARGTMLLYYATMVVLLITFAGEQQGWLTPRHGTVTSAGELATFLLVLTAAVAYQRLHTDSLLKATDSAQRSADSLARTNEQLLSSESALRAARDELEARVEERTAALAAREQQYRTLFHHAPVAVVVYDPAKEGFVEVNEIACELFGRSREALLGSPLEELGIRGAFEDPPLQAREAANRALRGELNLARVRLDRDPETSIPLEVRLAATRTPGPRLIYATAVDISERLAIEAQQAWETQRLRQMMAAMPMGVTLARAEEPGEILWTNGRMAAILETTTAAMLGRSIVDFYDDPEAAIQVQRKVVNEGRVVGEVIPARTDTGRFLWLRTFIERIDYGSEPALLAFVENISELKEAEERLREAQKIESLGMLAGGVAHDFNNLLVAILAQSSLAHRLLPSGHPAAKHLQKAVNAAERAADLTRQLLAYSGGGRFVLEQVNLNHVARESVTLLRAAIDPAVELRLELADSLAPVEGDAGQLQQIIMNLVLNGAEAFESGPGLVTVRTRNEELPEPLAMEEHLGYPLLPGAYAVVEIADTGPGMSGETRGRIFDPFFTTKPGGRGLGLAAVHGIVRGHRGGIVVDSAPDVGTRFLLYFPVDRAPVVAAEAPSPASLPAGAGQTILIIDDEAGVRETAADILTAGGYAVRSAADGLAGIRLFEAEIDRIALVLLDLSMPGLSGGETMEALRKIEPGVPILLSSGYSAQQITRRLDGADQPRFIQKPYTPAALLTAVGEMLVPDS